MQIGNLIDHTPSDEVSEEKTAHVIFNDNPGRGQHYIRMMTGYDEDENLLGHWFDYFIFDQGTEATAASPTDLLAMIPKQFRFKAASDVEAFKLNDYADMKAGIKEGEGEL